MIQKLCKIKLALLALILLIGSQGRLMQSQQPVNSITVPLNIPQQFDQSADTYKYYQVSVKNPSSDQVLMITVAADIQTWVGIFVSTSNSPDFVEGKWPDRSSFTQECFYSSLDTCALHMSQVSDLPNGQDTLQVYFSVSVNSDCSYLLQVSLQTIYQIQVNKKYSVKLVNAESAMLQLPASSFNIQGNTIQQIIITCFYTSFQNIGHFQLLAAEGDFPNPTQYSTIKSKSLNGFTQILQLNPLSQSNSSYYILIEGQNNTYFNFTIQAIESLDNPELIINDTVSYLTNRSINYTYNNMFPANFLNSSSLPLYVQLYAYRGYGKLTVDYCDGLFNFTFQNTGGEDGEVAITPELRKQCYQSVTSQGGLLIENVVVAITDVYYQFGFAIGLYENTFDNSLMTGQKQIGVLSGVNDSRLYNIYAYATDVNFTLNIQVFVGSINVTIEQCPQNSSNNTCQLVTNLTLTEPTDILVQQNFTCPAKSNCHVIINQYKSSNFSKFSLLNEYANKQSTQLLPNTPINDIVTMNSYKFYFINVTALRLNPMNKFSNSTVINVRRTQINGNTVLLTSTTVKQPTFEDMLGEKSDVQYNWEGSAIYFANATYPQYIYIGVLGDTQSIYHIQFVLNTSANIPSAYLDLVQDGLNDFTLTETVPFILLKYVSHIVPFSITFDPSPSCIKYGNQLPISNNCTTPSQMPNIFHDRVVYFNISQPLASQGAIFKFSAYVNSGTYLLSEDKPIFISCERACYELIAVVINTPSATILHSGQGSIKYNNSKGIIQEVDNGPLALTCSAFQCSFIINATINYGGSLQIAFQASPASSIQWKTKPMTLPDEGDTKYFYMRLPKYSDFYSFIFFTQAADLSIYYNIISFDESYTNIADYEYPTPTNYMDVSYGDPLQDIHVVDIDDQFIQSKKCKQRHIICIATFAVTLNNSVEYSSQYISSGLGYYSANTYQYDISPTWPVLYLKQQYSLSYFTHTINFVQEVTSFPYKIHLQPISNCRPQIQTQSTGYLRNYYDDIQLPAVMPGQTKVSYRILSNSICQFDTAITTSPYQLVFPNIIQNLEIEQNITNVTLTYQHRSYSTSTFTIRMSQQVAAIIVNPIKFTNDSSRPQIILPSTESGKNIGYTLNSSTLTITSGQITQYLIFIQLPKGFSNRSRTLSALVQLKNEAITLLHNQEHAYVYDPTDNSISAQSSGVVVYEYYSTSRFYIFISVSKLSAKLTVKDADAWGQNSQLVNVVINNQSKPWILISPKNSSTETLIKYEIKCEFLSQPDSGSTATIKIHIEEDGLTGLTQLYPGVSVYDAFVHDTAMNCYKFISPMILGEQTMTIDLNFIINQINLPQDGTKKNFVQGIASIEGSSTKKLQLTQFQITPTTFRLVMNFYAASTYKICYILQSLKMVGAEYSIVANVPSMPMIYSNTYPNQSSIYIESYVMFEYINYKYELFTTDELHSQPVIMAVTNCLGTSTILATSSYSDMTTGKMTQVTSQWTGNGVTAALVNVPHGYYYFAVKPIDSKTATQAFRASVEPAGVVDGKAYLLHSMYYINWNIKAKIGTLIINQIEYVSIQVPTILKSKSVGDAFNPTKIVYSLYLINLGNETSPQIYPYSIDTYTRCPSLFTSFTNHQNIPFNPHTVVTIAHPYLTSNPQQTVQFNVNINDFRPMSNISIKAEVYLTDDNGNSNILEYYYGQDQIQVIDDSQQLWRPFKWMLLLSIFFVFLGCVAFMVKYYLRKRGRTVTFEAAQYPMGQQMQPRPPTTPDTSSPTSNRRPLNSNAGYGQFVDEV